MQYFLGGDRIDKEDAVAASNERNREEVPRLTTFLPKDKGGNPTTASG